MNRFNFEESFSPNQVLTHAARAARAKGPGHGKESLIVDVRRLSNVPACYAGGRP